MPEADQKRLPAPPKLEAVVVSAGRWEARIASDKGIELVTIGDRGGRKLVLQLDASEATSVLQLIDHGRHVLMQMEETR